jgi:hypothetical protein
LSFQKYFVSLQKIIKIITAMRFYQEWGGFLWEFNSFKEFLVTVLFRFIGFVIGVIILIGIFGLMALCV